MTGLQETLTLAMTTPSLILGYGVLIAPGLRKLWFSVLLFFLSAAWAFHIFFDELLFDPLFTAQEVGCIGSLLTYLILGRFICAATLALTIIYRRR